MEIVRQEMHGLQRNLGWRWFWLARRRGKQNWHDGTTAREAIRKAVLLPPRKPPDWLTEAAATAERQLLDAPQASKDATTIDSNQESPT